MVPTPAFPGGISQRLGVIASGYRPHTNEVLAGFEGGPDDSSDDENAVAAESYVL